MNFEVLVTHDAHFARVRVSGPAPVGRVLSLMDVLKVDSSGWAERAVLLDLREVLPPLTDEEQAEVAASAARALARMERIAILSVPGATRESHGVRAFADEAAARDWLQSR